MDKYSAQLRERRKYIKRNAGKLNLSSEDETSPKPIENSSFAGK